MAYILQGYIFDNREWTFPFQHTLTRSGGLGGGGWTRPKACRGSPRRGFGGGGRSPPDAGKISKIFYKKPNEKLQF